MRTTILIFWLLILFLLTIPAKADEIYRAKYTPEESKGFDTPTEDEQLEFDKLVDSLIYRVCGFDLQLRNAQAAIDRQHEVQKLTGTIDLTQLNNAGAVIVDVTKLRNQLLEAYKNTMGRELTKYECDL